MKTVTCLKKKQLLPQLSEPPYPGDLGQRIFETISEPAWKEWLEYQTKLINEHKLKMFERSAQELIKIHMNYFLFEVPLPQEIKPLVENPTQKV